MPMKLLSMLLAATATAVLAPVLLAQTSQKSHFSSSSSHSQTRKYNFSLVTKDNNNVNMWGDMDGFSSDTLREKAKEDTLFVKKDGDLYAITDKSTIAQTKAAFEPMEKLGKQMGELGRQQGEVGREYGKVGAKQGEIGRKMGEVGREMGEAAREGKSMAPFREKMKQLQEEMKAAGSEIRAGLAEKQKAFGAKMGEFGRQMGAASKEADEKITKLIDDAFARGLAHKA